MSDVRKLIVKQRNFAPTEENVEFGTCEDNKNGQGKNTRFTYNGNTLFIKTDKMRTPFGLSRGKEGFDNYGKKLTVSLSYDLESEDGRQFLENMQTLDDIVAHTAYENRVAWGLGKNAKVSREMTEKEVRNMMTPSVKYKVDKETGEEDPNLAPTLRVTLNTRNHPETKEIEAITSQVFDDAKPSQRIMNVDDNTIRRGYQIKSLIYARSIWVTPTGYGISWRFQQLQVFPSGGFSANTNYLEDSDSEEEGAEANPSSSSAAPPTTEEDNAGEDDAGEDDEDEKPKVRSKGLSLRNRRA